MRSGLLPQEAPIMIVEKYFLFFCYGRIAFGRRQPNTPVPAVGVSLHRLSVL